MDGEDTEGVAARRSSLRKRHVAPKMAVVDDATRKQAAAARLDALENDNAMAPDVIEVREDDEAFNIDDEMDEVYGDKPRSRNKRRTRQRATEEKQTTAKKGPKTFEELLQEANLEALPAHVPSYLTASVGPPRTASRRHFCQVCGFLAPFTCTRCGTRFCSVKCQTVHNDTRCLKFVV